MTDLTAIRCRVCPTDINTYEVVRIDNGKRVAYFDLSDEAGETLAFMMFEGLMSAGVLSPADMLAALLNQPTAH